MPGAKAGSRVASLSVSALSDAEGQVQTGNITLVIGVAVAVRVDRDEVLGGNAGRWIDGGQEEPQAVGHAAGQGIVREAG